MKLLSLFAALLLASSVSIGAPSNAAAGSLAHPSGTSWSNGQGVRLVSLGYGGFDDAFYNLRLVNDHRDPCYVLIRFSDGRRQGLLAPANDISSTFRVGRRNRVTAVGFVCAPDRDALMELDQSPDRERIMEQYMNYGPF